MNTAKSVPRGIHSGGAKERETVDKSSYIMHWNVIKCYRKNKMGKENGSAECARPWFILCLVLEW